MLRHVIAHDPVLLRRTFENIFGIHRDTVLRSPVSNSPTLTYWNIRHNTLGNICPNLFIGQPLFYCVYIFFYSIDKSGM